jgi:uncharacterized protein YkwD
LAQSRPARAAGVAALAAALALSPCAAANPPQRARLATACPDAGTPAGSASMPALRRAVACLVNEERAAHRLPPLQLSSELTRSAQGWTDAMVAAGSFTHGADFATRISHAGYRWAASGENIATGVATARQLVSLWMADVGHCQNILSPLFRDIGVGVNRHPVPGVASTPATWTQDFGLHIDEPPPARDWGPAEGCPYR